MNLIALLGGGKKGGSSKGGSPEPAMDDESSERTYAREAFSALKDDDEDGFVEAFTSAVRACVKNYQDTAEPDADDSEA